MLLALTVVFDSSLTLFKTAKDRKSVRYTILTMDLKALGFKALNMPLEIGSRGIITAGNHIGMADVCSMSGINNLKTFRKNLGKISLLGSHITYLARRSSEWSGRPLIKA